MGLSHIAILNQTAGISIYGIAEPSKLLRKGLERNFGFKTFKNASELLNSKELDAVLIAAPNKLHYPLAKEALQRGLHCFIEKPFTTTPDDSKHLTDLAKKKDCYIQVGYVNRFNPVFQKLRVLLNEGIIGEVSEYRSTMKGAVVLEKGNSGWRSSYRLGGGCLNDYGPHCIDLGFYLFGSDVTLNTATLSKIHSSEVDDKAEFNVTHGNGIHGCYEVNWSVSELRKASNSVEIKGTLGTIEANKQEIKIMSTDGSHIKTIYVTDLDTDTDYYLRGEDFSKQLLEFSQKIRTGTEEAHSNIDDAMNVDFLIRDIFIASGVELNG